MTVLARASSAVFAIIVAFIVSPADFGIYGMLQAVALIAGTYQFLRIERAILIAGSIRKVMLLTHACIEISIVTTVFSTIACLLVVPGLTEQRNWHTLLVLFALSVFGKGLVLLSHAWMQRFGLRIEQPLLMIAQAIIQVLSQLALLYIGNEPLLALVCGELIGSTLAISSVLFLRRHWPILLIRRRQYSLRKILTQWSHFPVINMPAAICSQLLISLPLLTAGHLLPPDHLGNFALALRIADAPFLLMSAAAGTVMMTEGWHRVPHGGPQERRQLRLYLTGVSATGLAIATIGFAFALTNHLPDSRIGSAAMIVPAAVFLSMSLALGAPLQDIAAYRRGEAIMLLIHAGMALAGIMVWMLALSMRSVILYFSAIFLIRSIAVIVIAETGTSEALNRAPPLPPEQSRQSDLH